jgi:hypothetical protein
MKNALACVCHGMLQVLDNNNNMITPLASACWQQAI